jgi:HD-like signal output (HDOD) protein
MNQELIQKVLECPSLPSLPTVAMEVLQLTRAKEVNINELAGAISKDAALATKLLRTVNSSLYGHSQNISTIRHAVAFLGIDSVKSLVVGFSVITELGKSKPRGFNHLNYWRRSIYAATAARTLAEKLLHGNQETCFLVALLMDVGMLVLDRVAPREYGAVCDRARNHEELTALERRTLQLTHADVAKVLAEQWKLPTTLAVPMAHHHRPHEVEDPLERKLADIALLAGRCADVFVDAKPALSIADVRRLCMELYQISELECDAVLVNIGQRTRQLAPLFEIAVEANLTYEGILEEATEELLSLDLEKKPAAAAAEPAGAEKRRAPRIRKDNAIVILPHVSGVLQAPVTVRLKDVSSKGIGFYHKEPIEKGSQFVVQLPQKQGKPVSLLYNVVRFQAERPGVFVIGAELVRILNPEQVTARKERPVGAVGRITDAVLS